MGTAAAQISSTGEGCSRCFPRQRRVLQAQRNRNGQLEGIAIKAVLADVGVMEKAYDQGCPVAAPSLNCAEAVESCNILGWFHILGNVGTPVALDMARARRRDLVEALRQLHLNFVHGQFSSNYPIISRWNP